MSPLLNNLLPKICRSCPRVFFIFAHAPSITASAALQSRPFGSSRCFFQSRAATTSSIGMPLCFAISSASAKWPFASSRFPRFAATSPRMQWHDMSSDFLWQPLDVSRFDFIYAGAQKNIGPSGVVVCIVRKSLLERGRSDLPTIFQYRTHAEKDSMFNTPPTFAIYMIRNVLEWVRGEGGLSAMKTRNLRKANRLYDVIDGSDFFSCPVERGCRSTMNVVFRLPNEALEAQFLEESAAQGMSGLKGHRSVGGLRASIYNAAPYEWADGLGQFMTDFAARNG